MVYKNRIQLGLRLFSTTGLFFYGPGILIEISPDLFSAIIYDVIGGKYFVSFIFVIFRNKQTSKTDICTDCAMRFVLLNNDGMYRKTWYQLRMGH